MSCLCFGIGAKEVLGILQSVGLDPPILPRDDPGWARLRFGVDRSVSLRDRHRGALIGRAIGDAMGRDPARFSVSGKSLPVSDAEASWYDWECA